MAERPTELEPGLSGEVSWTVEERHCTRRGEHLIFSTPSMVLLLETASIEALRPVLGEGQASVGSRIDLQHLAPTLLGMTITATATVRAVDRRRVVLSVEIRDEVEKVGEARHERFVIDLDRYARRLQDKEAVRTGNDGP